MGIIKSSVYSALPSEFYIGETRFNKHSQSVDLLLFDLETKYGFELEITHEQIEHLKANTEGRNGIFRTIAGVTAGAAAITTLTGNTAAVPLTAAAAILNILMGILQLYIQRIINKDRGCGVYLYFYIGGIVPVPRIEAI